VQQRHQAEVPACDADRRTQRGPPSPLDRSGTQVLAGEKHPLREVTSRDRHGAARARSGAWRASPAAEGHRQSSGALAPKSRRSRLDGVKPTAMRMSKASVPYLECRRLESAPDSSTSASRLSVATALIRLDLGGASYAAAS